MFKAYVFINLLPPPKNINDASLWMLWVVLLHCLPGFHGVSQRCPRVHGIAISLTGES